MIAYNVFVANKLAVVVQEVIYTSLASSRILKASRLAIKVY